MTELLAPAGSREALSAAFESGADAVYLAGRMFGARHYAPNFSDEELAEVVREAHLRAVKIYVTVNTLVDNSEMPALAAYLRYLYQIGVDAVIVQDVGVAAAARRVAPGLPLHASTQMTVHNLAGVEFLAERGFARVVLARELSLDDIRHICRNSPIEIETFIHGALCISYSGQCLMSSMIGGRSGNRGKCAQPCRLPYTLVDAAGRDALAGEDAGEYLLSPRDFNTLEHLGDLIDAGVASFKIEGRMKRAEYVAIVVDAYRRAIDACPGGGENLARDQKDMAQVFNRGFTTAYLYGKPGKTMMSDRRPNNRGVHVGRVLAYSHSDRAVTLKLDEPLARGDGVEFWVKVGGRSGTTVTTLKVDGKPVDYAPAGAQAVIGLDTPVRPGDRVFKTNDIRLTEKARSFFTAGAALRRIPVDAAVTVAEGRPLVIRLSDDSGNSGEGRTAFRAEKALKRPLNEETIAKQAGRLGTTVFELRRLDCAIDGEVMVPVSEINEARRQAVERLEAARLARYARPPLTVREAAELLPPIAARAAVKPRLAVNVDTLAKAEAALENGADIIMFGGETLNHRAIPREEYRQAVSLARGGGREIVLSTPRLVSQGQMADFAAELQYLRELGPDALSVGNAGALHLAAAGGGPALHGDYPLNVFNSAAVDFYACSGLDIITLSPELTFAQISDIAARTAVPLECLAHGYLTLMISEYCALGSFRGGLHQGPCSRPCLKGGYWLRDRMEEKFRVATDQYCRMHILNAKELSLLAHVPRFGKTGIDRIRFEAKAAAAGHVAAVTRLYRELLDMGEDHPLYGKEGVAPVEHENITRGHYFRGVL